MEGGCCEAGTNLLFLSKIGGRETMGLRCIRQKLRSDTAKALQLWTQKCWDTLRYLIITGGIKNHVRLASLKRELGCLSLLERRGQGYNWDPTSPVVL